MFEEILFNLLIAGLVFAPLERLAPISKGRPAIRSRTLLDLCHAIFSGLMIVSGLVVVISLAAAAAKTPALAAVGEALRTQPLFIQVIEATIVADLGFYAAHRTFHSVPALWRIHKVHHSIEELDWLAAYRVHPIDQILTMTASLGPVFLLGFAPEATAIMAIIYRWHSLLIHSNVDLRFGPLRHVFASPRFHHWHHANHEEAFDRNFAGQLAFIDRIFGTLYLPHDRMPKRYGVDDPPPMDYIGQLISPLKPAPPKDAAVSGAQS